MGKKLNVKKMIKILSWTSVFGILTMTIISIYNALAYLKNLEDVKTIVELINQNTSKELKEEVIRTILANIHSSQMVLAGISLLGMGILAYIVYLGISIKKETDRRIHAMDWIIEEK